MSTKLDARGQSVNAAIQDFDKRLQELREFVLYKTPPGDSEDVLDAILDTAVICGVLEFSVVDTKMQVVFSETIIKQYDFTMKSRAVGILRSLLGGLAFRVRTIQHRTAQRRTAKFSELPHISPYGFQTVLEYSYNGIDALLDIETSNTNGKPFYLKIQNLQLQHSE